MNLDLLFIGISNLFVALICVGFSIPLLNNRVKRNSWYGVRIPKSYASEDNWMKINAYGARAMIYWSIPVLLIGIISVIASFFVSPSSPQDIAWVIPVSLTSLIILGALIQTVVWSHRLPS